MDHDRITFRVVSEPRQLCWRNLNFPIPGYDQPRRQKSNSGPHKLTSIHVDSLVMENPN